MIKCVANTTLSIPFYLKCNINKMSDKQTCHRPNWEHLDLVWIPK